MTGENRWYVDLATVVVITGFALLVIVTGGDGWLRTALTVPLVTILPGYALFAFLYPGNGSEAIRTFDENERGLHNPLPGKEGIDPVERFALSVVASVVLVPLIALGANFTPWGITLTPILFGTAGFTLLLSFGALVRRARLHPEERYTPTPSRVISNVLYSAPRSEFAGDNSRTRRFNILLVASLLLLAGSVGFAAVNPPQSEGFTEFYVETENVTGDTQSMYPSQFSAGESRELPVVVSNQEHEQTDYTVFVLLQQVEGTGDDATVSEERELTRESVTVEQGSTRNVSLSITPRSTGTNLRLAVLLYQGDSPSDPSIETADQALRLPIVVEDDAGSTSTSAGSLDAPERTLTRTAVS